MDKIYKVKDGFILKQIGPKMMAVPVKNRIDDVNGLIAMSKSGALLWKELENGASIEKLTDILLETYDVEKDKAQKDVKNFLDYLESSNVLE